MTEQELRAVKGTIFNIQHYCIHDGPGIRTNVFIKGCPLRCIWCANPESQLTVPQLMFRSDKCTGCGACVSACPEGAVKLLMPGAEKPKDAGAPENLISLRTAPISSTDRAKCRGCGACADVCRPEAREITGRVAEAGEVFDEVYGDALFYGDDGGVTVTGGEALAHPEFTYALLSLCRSYGIGTAIETCGFARWDVMEPILKLADIVLYDNKEMNSELHRKYTGAGNELILENLRKINDLTDCEIWLRVPTIPGYNDDPGNIRAVAELARSLGHISQVHLLPFHKLGLSKFEQLENEPNGFSSEVPGDDYMESLRDIVREYGIICK